MYILFGKVGFPDSDSVKYTVYIHMYKNLKKRLKEYTATWINHLNMLNMLNMNNVRKSIPKEIYQYKLRGK